MARSPRAHRRQRPAPAPHQPDLGDDATHRERLSMSSWYARQYRARGAEVPAEIQELEREARRLGYLLTRSQRRHYRPPRATCERAAVIGDVHGDARALKRLLDRIESDREVFVVGDLCDRGPDTRGALDLLIARGARGVLGNHDLVFLCAIDGELDPTWLLPDMGGRATLASYGITSHEVMAEAVATAVPESHVAFLAALSHVLDLTVGGDRYWLAHAGLPTHRDVVGVPFDEIVEHLARQYPDDLLWARNDVEVPLPVGRPVISGHISRDEPLVSDDAIAIDVRGALTAVLLPERRFVNAGVPGVGS